MRILSLLPLGLLMALVALFNFEILIINSMTEMAWLLSVLFLMLACMLITLRD